MPSYTVFEPNITNAANKNMLAISNQTGSNRVIRIYRIWIGTQQIAAVVGGICFALLSRTVAPHSGGTACLFRPHNSAVTDGTTTPFTGIFASQGATAITATISNTFLRVARPTDEITAEAMTLDEVIAMITPWSLVWNSGYQNNVIEPITIRPNEGFLISLDAVGQLVGSMSIGIELTIETS
jgi:hypothetical protein